MSNIKLDTFVAFIKENIKVHITLLIVSGLIIFIKDETIKGLVGMQVPSYMKLFFLILFLVACIVLIFDLIEYLFNRKRKEKEQALEKVMEMFSPLKMGEKINILYDWFKTYEDALKEYKGQLQLPTEDQSEKFKKTHTIRREVANCFDQALKYHKKKYISEEQLKEIIAISHVRALLEVIEPLELQIGKNYHREVFKFFGKLYRKELNKKIT